MKDVQVVKAKQKQKGVDEEMGEQLI